MPTLITFGALSGLSLLQWGNSLLNIAFFMNTAYSITPYNFSTATLGTAFGSVTNGNWFSTGAGSQTKGGIIFANNNNSNTTLVNPFNSTTSSGPSVFNISSADSNATGNNSFALENVYNSTASNKYDYASNGMSSGPTFPAAAVGTMATNIPTTFLYAIGSTSYLYYVSSNSFSSGVSVPAQDNGGGVSSSNTAYVESSSTSLTPVSYSSLVLGSGITNSSVSMAGNAGGGVGNRYVGLLGGRPSGILTFASNVISVGPSTSFSGEGTGFCPSSWNCSA